MPFHCSGSHLKTELAHCSTCLAKLLCHGMAVDVIIVAPRAHACPQVVIRWQDVIIVTYAHAHAHAHTAAQ